MAENTKIEWCTHTWNVWRGCEEVHTGCENCYAKQMALRNPKQLGTWGPDGERVSGADAMWNAPLRWQRKAEKTGQRVSCFPSMMDPFEDRPDLVPWRERMMGIIDQCWMVDFLLLTKRPGNVRRMWPMKEGPTAVDLLGPLPSLDNGVPWSDGDRTNDFRSNVWIGTSISDQETADKYVPELLKLRDLTPCLFLSCEPLVGPVDLMYPKSLFPSGPRYCCSGHDCGCAGRPIDPPLICGGTSDSWIDWVIVGGESGTSARPCEVGWIRSLVRDCKSADVPVFVKQLGAACRGDQPLILDDDETSPPARMPLWLKHPKGGDPNEWPEDLRVREFPRLERVGGP